MNTACTLTDDDGVLVISTTRQMEFWKDHRFEYGFPDELLDQMRQSRMIAWESGSEGKHSVVIAFPSSAPSHPKHMGPFPLQALEEDKFIIMPYSQFTYAAARKAGVVRDIEGLSFRFNIQAGDYYIYISKTNETDWQIDLCPPNGAAPYIYTDELPQF